MNTNGEYSDYTRSGPRVHRVPPPLPLGFPPPLFYRPWAKVQGSQGSNKIREKL